MGFANQKRASSATVDASGNATVEIVPTSAYAWSVTQVSVELAAAPAGAQCSLRLNGVFITALIATGDVASGDPPILIQPGDRLTVDWTGCTPGSVGTVLAIYDETA